MATPNRSRSRRFGRSLYGKVPAYQFFEAIPVDSLLFILSVVLLTVLPCVGIAVVGWPIARLARAYTDPLERLVLCVLSGSAILFVLQGLAYVSGAPSVRLRFSAVVILLWSAWRCVIDFRRDEGRLLGQYARPLLTWMALSLFGVACGSVIEVQGVPNQVLDWWEHYRRAQIFLFNLPPDTLIGGWTVAARGPLFNAAAALLMGVTGEREYWAFSIFSVVLNAQVFLPLALLFRRSAGLSTNASLWTGAVVILCVPFFNSNLVFTGPKLAATSGVLAALAFSLKGVESKDARLFGWSIVALAVGFLAHFFVFLYAVLLLPHVIYSVFRSRLSFRPVIAGVLAGGLLVGGWMFFLVRVFGVEGTLKSNSTFGQYRGWGPDLDPKYEGDRTLNETMILNAAASLLPASIRGMDLFHGTLLDAPPPGDNLVISGADPPVRLPGNLRPEFMMHTLQGATGWTGISLFVLSLIAYPFVRRRLPHSSARGFWVYFVVVGIPLNLSAVTWYSVTGVIGQHLLPYIGLGIVWLASQRFAYPVWFTRSVVIVGLSESIFRVGQMLSYQATQFPVVVSAGEMRVLRPFVVEDTCWFNYGIKIANQIVMLRDVTPPGGYTTAAVTTLAGILCIAATRHFSKEPVVGER